MMWTREIKSETLEDKVKIQGRKNHQNLTGYVRQTNITFVYVCMKI